MTTGSSPEPASSATEKWLSPFFTSEAFSGTPKQVEGGEHPAFPDRLSVVIETALVGLTREPFAVEPHGQAVALRQPGSLELQPGANARCFQIFRQSQVEGAGRGLLSASEDEPHVPAHT